MIRKLKLMVRNILYTKGYVITTSMRGLDGNRKDIIKSSGDFVRISSLELIAREIYENHIPGCAAELGVYKGDFAKIINVVFPDRKLYLFDTFEGFSKKDVLVDKSKRFSKANQDFSDTYEALVLKKMRYKKNVIIVKGYFPDSASRLKDIDELKFAFVSIDVDLYQPTLAGLEFFYPKLSRGGYVFVHDYNNSGYKGIKEAVREFCKTNNISFFPLSDGWGSAVILK